MRETQTRKIRGRIGRRYLVGRVRGGLDLPIVFIKSDVKIPELENISLRRGELEAN